MAEAEAAKTGGRRAERRVQIARAALAVMAREGVARLTARRVVAEAGLSLGHLTYNFDGMDEVLSEAYRLLSADLAAAGEAALQGADGPKARVSAFLRTGFAAPFLTPDHLRLRLDLWSAARWHPGIAATERDLYERYRARLEGLLAPFGADPARVTAVVDVVMAALDGLWLDHARRADQAALARGLAECEALLFSLGPEGSGGQAAGRDPSPR
ncbi:TetR/AcrR family transcriptional regulator [Tabrizicola sp. TH137]|uniref:TetR/AcrR family transcriptional regulator n=1 Tax=Tabrizicola sp. TH137 TaxID=2067452 RepID=UPI0013044E57|nr:TetR family transcriptional regulator C-terminal domain-containing protein [Tabrizicola sp. TH137]